jgi:hypothetical protein
MFQVDFFVPWCLLQKENQGKSHAKAANKPVFFIQSPTAEYAFLGAADQQLS